MPPPAEGFASRLVLGPALRAQPDRRLVTLVREGYEAAFEEIVRRYAKPLARYAGAIVGARAEDVIQDAFSKALEALRRDESEIDLRPWLYRIVRNTALNDLRDRPEEAEALAESIAGGRTAAEVAVQREQLADLIAGLRALPEPQRAAIVMRELEGLSHDEIAAALGLSGGGARQAIYRARQALRDGAALLLPLPFLRFLIDHGGEAAAAGAGAGAGGAVATAAGASAGGAAGGGVALKAGVAAAVLAGSVGTGVALRDEGGGRTADASPPAAKSVGAPAAAPPSTPSAGLTSDSPVERSGDEDRGRGGEDRGAENRPEGDHDRRPGGEPGDERHGRRGEEGRRGRHRGRGRGRRDGVREGRPPPRERERHGARANSGPRPERHRDRSGPGGGGKGHQEGEDRRGSAGGGPGPAAHPPPPPPPQPSPPPPEEEVENPEPTEEGEPEGDRSAPGGDSRDLEP